MMSQLSIALSIVCISAKDRQSNPTPLSSANLTKIMLAKKIKKQIPNLKISIIKNIKDPDQRDYYVSNKKIEKKGFKARIKIEDGIKELINIFSYSKEKITNNY